MSLQLTFKLEMRSDYHVGAGHGRGTELDSALLRDADGVPVLRGTMINGLLRDSLWRLLQLPPLTKYQNCPASGKSAEDNPGEYCGQYAQPDHIPELCPVCRLFGTPRHRKRWRIGSARPIDRQEFTGTAYQPEDLPGQQVARVRVNPRTRRAAARQLFSEEQGGQQDFVFTATCPTDGEDALDDAALLVAAARFIRELGRARRRGLGECLISLVEVAGIDLGDDPQANLLTRFEEHWLHSEPALLLSTQKKGLEVVPFLGDATEHPLRWWVLVRLQEPLIVAERAAAGNRFQSRDAIPGTVLRGALADRVAQAFDLSDDIVYTAFLHLFLRDGIRFPTLYPLSRDKSTIYPAIPLPRDAFACKICADPPIVWGTVGQGAQCPACQGTTKAARGQFYPLRALAPKRFDPEERVEMHIRIDPNTGRVEEGQLFDYVPLEAGQYFAGELRCSDKETWQLFQTFTGLAEEQPFDLRLGKATRRGYGKVTLWISPMTGEQPPFWSLLPLTSRVPEQVKEITLTLLTDAIVQDTWGRFATGFEDEWLQEELKLPVTIVAERDFAGRRITDGYNTQWHLPTWRAMALEAGSSVRLRLAQSVTAEMQEHLRKLEQEGIGERRNEGYGSVVFNHPLYSGFAGIQRTSVDIPQVLRFASIEESHRDVRTSWQDRLDQFATDHQQQWRQLTGAGQPLTALARWLMQNRDREIPILIEEITAFGIADESLKSLIKAQGHRDDEDEYGDRPQENRLEKIQAIGLCKELLRKLNDQPRGFWPEGIRIMADQFAGLAEMEKEVH
jgi:CRISPR-associated protein Csx10